MLILLLACAGNLSNDPFTEDAVFLSALPPAGLLQLEYPSDLESADAELLGVALSQLDAARALTSNFASVTEVIQAVSPSERGQHHRVWGPGAWDAVPGAFLRVEMTRTSDGATYLTTFQTAATSDGPWQEFFEGDATLDPDVPLGQQGPVSGTLRWDASALDQVVPDHGTESVRFDYQAEPDGPLSLQIIAPLDLSFKQQPDDSGNVWLSTRLDIAGEGSPKTGPIPEDIELELAWGPNGAGRGRLQAEGGDLPWATATIEECWQDGGERVWVWADPVDLGNEEGESALCTIQAFEG
ncbi:MAG: hypothetical protein ACI9VR_003723 [Cognaticolwellia sp.]|jgi:hypothetical protein